jgi:S2P endopeptidase
MILFPVALFFMIFSLCTGSSETTNLSENTGKTSVEEVAHLEILLPGVNLPLNQIGYYILSLLICSFVHEAGHGIAAVIEEIPVSGFGMHLFFILPIAYTQIDTENLQAAKVWKKLKIFSAGIWNNLILAGWCYILLLLLPILLTPLYNSNEAVFIKKIKLNAPVLGENGLYVGDSVYKINDCNVSNEDEWLDCLTESLNHHPAYCVDENFVHENEESVHELEHLKDGTITCCGSNPALNCFENFDEERLPQYVCLNIRNTIEHAKHYCHKKACPDHVSCVKPLLPNTTTIIHIKRRNRTKDFVYYGHPLDILNYVDISNFVPKTKVFEPSLADAISLMLKYLIVFSSGLAVVNVIPCYGLDGQFLVNTIITNLPSKYFSKARKEILSVSINLIGTFTLLLAIIKIIWTTFL